METRLFSSPRLLSADQPRLIVEYTSIEFRWAFYLEKWRVGLARCAHIEFPEVGKVPNSKIKKWGPWLREPIPVTPPVERKKTIAEQATVESAKDDAKDKEDRIESWHRPDHCWISSERNNDCIVVTLANIASLYYSEAKLLAFHSGWSSTKGALPGIIEAIMEERGHPYTFRRDLIGRAVQHTIFPDGVFAVYVRNHVFPVINSQSYNVSNACEVVSEVYEFGK